MPLSPGAPFGPYVVQDLLGKGGMGEVYRAEVKSSGEPLALKILSENFAQDPERLARFELEVKALGAMHHPNIPVFLEAGQVDGVPFLAMELLQGETLEMRLERGPLPIRIALEFARDIVRGLGAAHVRGIIHRDLKPANIFLRDDGTLKILDFGLAKDVSAALGEQTMSSPTSPAQTRLGTLIGTVGYMAPEQVRGQKVDHRADLFAVGILLYQMLFGEPPFQAESPFDVLSAILKDTPSGLSQAARSGISKDVTDLVARCLEKQPEKRFQTTGELLVQLDVLLGDRPQDNRRWPGLLRAALAGAALLGALSAGGWFGWRSGRREPPTMQQLTFRQGYLRSARFDPTGDGVHYSAAWSGEPVRIYGTRPERPESRQLDLAASELLAISTRGDMAVSLGSELYQSWVYRGTLARTHLGGGTPRVLLEGVLAADWVGDGEDLALVRYFGGKCRLEYPMGNTLFASSGWISHARVSPDGQGIAFIHHPVGGDDLGHPCYVDMKGHLTELTGSWSSAQGLAWNGDEVWFTAAEKGVSRALWAVDRAKRLRLVARYPSPLTLHDISRDGKRILLAKEFLRTGIKVKVPDAPIEREMSWLDWSLLQDLSPDGKTLLFSEQGAGSGAEYGVYLRPTDGSPAVLLGKGANPMLSPDGKWVAALRQSAGAAPFLMATDTGESRPIHGAEGLVIQRLRWFPDGKALILSANLPGKGIQLFRLGLEGGAPTPISPEGFRILGHPISPDGKWVAAFGVDGGSVLFSTERSEQRSIPGLDPLERVVGWSEDGRSLFATNLWKMPCTLTRLNLATGRRETALRLLAEDPAGLSISNFAVRKDGKAYAYAYRRVLSELYLVEGLK